METAGLSRCQWVSNAEDYQRYHDEVWGRPVTDAKELFAKLCLDGQQAGLSWITILRRQQGYYAAYDNFEPSRIAQYDDTDIQRLMQDTGIIRNRQKVHSIINNARAYEAMRANGGCFSAFLWGFVGHRTRINAWRRGDDLPAMSPESQAMSKALKQSGFSFVGPTICYAFMQAVGMVNDHLVDCHCYRRCCELAIRRG